MVFLQSEVIFEMATLQITPHLPSLPPQPQREPIADHAALVAHVRHPPHAEAALAIRRDVVPLAAGGGAEAAAQVGLHHGEGELELLWGEEGVALDGEEDVLAEGRRAVAVGAALAALLLRAGEAVRVEERLGAGEAARGENIGAGLQADAAAARHPLAVRAFIYKVHTCFVCLA